MVFRIAIRRCFHAWDRWLLAVVFRDGFCGSIARNPFKALGGADDGPAGRCGLVVSLVGGLGGPLRIDKSALAHRYGIG